MSNEVPLHQVIEFIFGKTVLKINTNYPKDAELVRDILEALDRARHTIDGNPIQSARPNEVGNLIEEPIRNSLSALRGYTAEIPRNRIGKKQSSGYPDILLTDKYGRFTYIECKSANALRKNQGMRTFYLSQPDDIKTAKVNKEARHLVALFTMSKEDRGYIATEATLIDIYELPCKLKQEWNSDNRKMHQQPKWSAGRQ
ncbi:MAG: hypothetical protein OXU53_03440 [Deltaproteobacteria bacterium]|nr:hypothetical protein [Deltaproteobacteria bacterium]